MCILGRVEGVYYYVLLKFNYVYDKFDMWIIKIFYVVVMLLIWFYWLMEVGEFERK